MVRTYGPCDDVACGVCASSRARSTDVSIDWCGLVWCGVVWWGVVCLGCAGGGGVGFGLGGVLWCGVVWWRKVWSRVFLCGVIARTANACHSSQWGVSFS